MKYIWFEKWVKNASEKELEDAYEEERQKWIREGCNKGTGEKTYKMKRINDELNKRAAKKREKDPKNKKDPNYRWTDANRWE